MQDHGRLKESLLRKCRESMRVKEEFFTANSEVIIDCAKAMAKAFENGGRLFLLGNGGSACDAQHMALEFMHPVIAKRPALPAMALMTDSALISAVANDQDFSQVFVGQLRMLSKPGDLLLGISTSGQSANVNRAFRVASELKLMTIGMVGRDGGKLKDLCDYCLRVPSFSIHRIQETHVTLLHVLWDLIHIIGGHEDVI